MSDGWVGVLGIGMIGGVLLTMVLDRPNMHKGGTEARLSAPNFTTGYVPDQEFQDDVSVRVHFIEPEKISLYCGDDAQACYKVSVVASKAIYIPNPCDYSRAGLNEAYADTLCHEIGHVNGWRHSDD